MTVSGQAALLGALRPWSQALLENSLPPLAGFSKEDVLGNSPLQSMFPSCKGAGGVCQDLLWPQARGVGRPGGNSLRWAGFPSTAEGCSASLLPDDLGLLGLFTVGNNFLFQERVGDWDGPVV